jgi:hypothetical protein
VKSQEPVARRDLNAWRAMDLSPGSVFNKMSREEKSVACVARQGARAGQAIQCQSSSWASLHAGQEAGTWLERCWRRMPTGSCWKQNLTINLGSGFERRALVHR